MPEAQFQALTFIYLIQLDVLTYADHSSSTRIRVTQREWI